MKQSQPLAASSQLLKQVTEIHRKKNQDEVSLYRLRREAESLVKRSGQPSDYVVLGAIQTLLNYPDKVRDSFDLAINLFPTEYPLYVNYSVSLNNSGLIDQAITYAVMAYEMCPGDLFIINHLINCYIGNGQLALAQKWCEKWQQQKPQEPHKISQVIERALQILETANVSEKVVISFFKIAYSVLHDNGIYYLPDRNLYLQQDDESEWIAFQIDILRPVDEVVDLSVALAERFAETDIGQLMANKLVIGYESGL
jgi:tetratricopeptide (TPR) repeat protein